MCPAAGGADVPGRGAAEGPQSMMGREEYTDDNPYGKNFHDPGCTGFGHDDSLRRRTWGPVHSTAAGAGRCFGVNRVRLRAACSTVDFETTLFFKSFIISPAEKNNKKKSFKKEFFIRNS